MADFLDPVVIRVKADVDAAIAKIRAVKAELNALRDTTVKVKIKDEFKEANAALSKTRQEVRGLDSDTSRLGRAVGLMGRSWKDLFSDIRKGSKEGVTGFSGRSWVPVVACLRTSLRALRMRGRLLKTLVMRC
jgi:hypothetical protein